MPKRRTILVLALLVLGTVVGAYFGGQLALVDTTTHFTNLNEHQFRGWFDGRVEMLDSNQYIAAWTDVDHSEKIVAQYQLCQVAIPGWAIQNAPSDDNRAPSKAFFYEVWFNGVFVERFGFTKDTVGAVALCPGSAFTVPTGWTSAPLFETVLVGKDTGVLKVVAAIYMNGGLLRGKGWYGIGDDQANVFPGSGWCIVVSPTGRPAAPGEQITVSCDLGYASSHKSGESTVGWQLFGDWSSVPIAALGPGPAFDKRVSFAAPSTTGIHTIRLVNTVFPKDAWTFTVSVEPEKAPPKPVLTLTPQPPWLTGQSPKVGWSASPGPDGTPIKQVHVRVFYTTGEKILEQTVAGAAGSVTFGPIGKDIDIRLSVVAEDAKGRFSEPAQPTIAVEGCDLFNACDGDGDGGFTLPIWAILVLIGIAAVLVAFLIPFVPIWPWKVIIVLVGGIFILLAVIVFPR